MLLLLRLVTCLFLPPPPLQPPPTPLFLSFLFVHWRSKKYLQDTGSIYIHIFHDDGNFVELYMSVPVFMSLTYFQCQTRWRKSSCNAHAECDTEYIHKHIRYVCICDASLSLLRKASRKLKIVNAIQCHCCFCLLGERREEAVESSFVWLSEYHNFCTTGCFWI